MPERKLWIWKDSKRPFPPIPSAPLYGSPVESCYKRMDGCAFGTCLAQVGGYHCVSCCSMQGPCTLSHGHTKLGLASAGNRTRAARVAGEHSTTEPPMLRCEDIGVFQSGQQRLRYQRNEGWDRKNILLQCVLLQWRQWCNG